MYPFPGTDQFQKFSDSDYTVTWATISRSTIQHLQRCVPTTVWSWRIVQVLFSITGTAIGDLDGYVTWQP